MSCIEPLCSSKRSMKSSFSIESTSTSAFPTPTTSKGVSTEEGPYRGPGSLPIVADYRLPRTVVPRRYELRIEPDLAAATFTGREDVTVDVVEPVTEVVLNAAELVVDEAWLESNDGTRLAATTSLDPESARTTRAL